MNFTEKDKKTVGTILVLAIISNGIWLFEIVKKTGGYGTAWLQTDLLTPIIISMCIALAYITPFWMGYQRIDGRIVLSTLTYGMINLSTYFLTSIILRGSLVETSFSLHLLKIIVLALFAGGYFYVTDQLIMPLEKKRIALFGFSTIGILLFSWITIFFIKGYGSNTSFLDAFKMGYPFFWAAMILGFIGIFLVETHNEQ
jgi:hypothetical protein